MMGNTTLGDLINWLELQDPEMIVKDGFDSPHCDRGDYRELAFSPKSDAKIGDMLFNAKSAIGKTYTGYKGGNFVMNEHTPVLVGEYGECGEEITTTHFKYWALTGKAS